MSGVKRWAIVAFGALAVLTGILLGVSGEGDERGAGILALIPLGLAMLSAAWLTPTGRGAVEGTRLEEGGTRFPVKTTRERAATVGCAAMSVAGLGFALFPGGFDEDPTYTRVVGTLCALMFGGVALVSARTLLVGGTRILLTPDHIVQSGGWGTLLVPWDAIDEVWTLSIRGADMIGLIVSDHPGIRAPRSSRMVRPLQRSMGADFTVPLAGLGVDPDAFLDLVVHMHEHPADRQWLAEPNVMERLRASRSGLTAGAD